MSFEQIRSSPDTCVRVVMLLSQRNPDLLIDLLGEIADMDAMACDEPGIKVICASIPAKETHASRIKFNALRYGMIQWEDAPQNQALAGDVFIFWNCASDLFTFHKVHYIIEGKRNVIGMSDHYMSLTYDEMIAYGAKPKHGTYYPKAGFEPKSELMRRI